MKMHSEKVSLQAHKAQHEMLKIQRDGSGEGALTLPSTEFGGHDVPRKFNFLQKKNNFSLFLPKMLKIALHPMAASKSFNSGIRKNKVAYFSVFFAS